MVCFLIHSVSLLVYTFSSMKTTLLLTVALLSVFAGYWIGNEDKELHKVSVSIEEPVPNCTSIPLDIYNTHINVAYVPDMDASGRAFGGEYTIHIKHARIQTLAHEAMHVADFIIEDRGLTGYESRAYLVGYITGELYKCFHGNKQ